ncbi:MAG: hypothetical protein R3F39_24120 [Myxococcota bacterium]
MAAGELVETERTALARRDPRRPYTRRLSPVERVWLVADAMEPPFAPVFVLEGEGALDPVAFERAVELAAAVNPGVAVVLRGWVGWTRWVGTGPAPRVRSADGSGWDGRGPGGAPWLAEPMDPRRGPVLDFTLLSGPTPRVLVRMHHSAMDGRGLFVFLDDLFSALRGEALVGSPSEVTDLELARRLAPAKNPRRVEDCLAPTGERSGAETSSTWRRLSVPGRFSRILPTVLCCLAREARRHATGEVRIGVPVDLRARADADRSTANLTGIVDLEVPEGATPDSVQATLDAALASHRAAAFVLEAEFILGVPLWLATAVARASTRRVCRKNRYDSSGTVSNLGRVPIERFSGGGFRTKTAFFIPPGTPSHACFIILCGHEQGIEAVVTMPGDLASDDRLDALMVRLNDALVAASSVPRLS